ncbi:hypothetical protein COB11_06925 [Candidatus Aerophobetes bacterium]|uniref:Lipopolysaccharide heptosyltransferase family protein n=1 Tax=Aerophobetes bacterium TaxID=2030807 RepID=A0A2A4YEA3_UNCAE|nr:MAG: hypothetical protein COB11_06925 [Candidatus Aerophobetes bacterium]
MNVAVLCANGLGDGLLMMIIATNFSKRGHTVTLFHDDFSVLSPLFPKTIHKKYPDIKDFYKTFKDYDLLLVENDNSDKAWELIRLRNEEKLDNVTFLFPTPCKKAETKRDYTFNPKLPVATNLEIASKRLLQFKEASKNNGITLGEGLISRKYKNRVVLHPTSKDPKRNWKKEQFIKLAHLLQEDGFTIALALSKEERKSFEDCREFLMPEFDSFKDLASYIYESGYLIGNDSGLGHLASNLNVPTLTISGNPKRVKLWRPDWYLNKVVTLKCELPNFKGIGFRFRESYWQNFISVSRVYKQFNKLIGTHDT